MINEFLRYISLKNVFQEKYLIQSMDEIRKEEYIKLNNLLKFYTQKYTVEEIADAYLNWIQVLMQEQKYFSENLCYRNKKLTDIKHLYDDNNYMKNYIIGLGLSTYLWNLHRDMMRFFVVKMKELPRKGRYLEIGPGHGEYFVSALESTSLDEYIGLDISDTSVEMTKAFIKHSIKKDKKKYEILNKDFFEYDEKELFDVVVMGEVLEHVENPLEFLRKIYRIANKEAFIYITTAINAPQPDHLYLFRNIEEIEMLFGQANLKIVESLAVTTNKMSIEKALEKNRTVTVAFVLKKITNECEEDE